MRGQGLSRVVCQWPMQFDYAAVSFERCALSYSRLASKTNILRAYTKSVECQATLLEELRTAVAVQKARLLLLFLPLELEKRRLSVKEGLQILSLRTFGFQQRCYRPHRSGSQRRG